MKLKNLLLLTFLLGSMFTNAQTQGIVSGKTYDLESVKVVAGDFIITINADGMVSDFNAPTLNGKFEYYDDKIFDKIKYGKLKSIAGVKVDYWNEVNRDNIKNGKLKSIGNIFIDYWDDFAFAKEKSGKVKKIGDLNVDYWPDDIIDNSRMGKLKSIGNVSIDYGTKNAVDSSKFKKLIKFGPVRLDYSDERFSDGGYGQLKSINGNSDEISVVVL